MKVNRFAVAVAVAAISLGSGGAAQNPPTTFPLGVSFDPTGLSPATVQLYQNFENTLQGFTGLPNNRSAFFAGYVNDSFVIQGWQALITGAQENCNGYLVTLSVQPNMSNGGDAVIRDLAYFEQYQINNNGTFTYVDSLDPNGQSGLVSTDIDSY